MNLLEHYQHINFEENERDILCHLLDKNNSTVNLGIKEFSIRVSNHVGAKDLARLFREILAEIISNNGFINSKNEFLTPKESLDMIDCVLYLEILFEEFIKKSGRRGFFLGHYKSVSHEWCYLAFEFILCKSLGYSARDLLALFIGLLQYDLKIISALKKNERIKIFINLTRRNQIGVFQDGSYIGYKNYKQINDVENILQLIFDEIDLLTQYYQNKNGIYFELFGKIQGIKELSPPKKAIPKPPLKLEKVLSPLEINLKTLNLKELPANEKELKKIFYKLAMTTHPDKFQHLDQGTKTEIAIIDKFREIHSAYEFIENELKQKNKS